MHDPVLHRFIAYLGEKRAEQEANPENHIQIELSREQIAAVRESFKQNILDGERLLHNLSHLLASVLLEGDFELHSNVIGALPGAEERPFLIRERITQETLFSVTDIDLGNQMLDNFRYRLDRAWVPLTQNPNTPNTLPTGRPETGVNRITSRVKAEEELWNKVTDEIFALDDLVSRDKHLRQYSKYVKDIFGIKLVCEYEPTCLRVHEQLQKLTYNDLHKLNLGWIENLAMPEQCERDEPVLDFIETKNYLTCDPSEMKQTGWKALKSVVKWGGRLFEIQVQPLANYYLELDHMSGPSHGSFKIQRDKLRKELAERIPLYGFYRDLLKMLFMETDVSFECHNASVVIN